MRYHILKLEKHKIEETEKTAFKVKKSGFSLNYGNKTQVYLSNSYKLVANHHKQCYWTNQSENSLLKAWHRLYLYIMYAFLPFLACFLYKKNAKRGIPNIFQKFCKNI